MRQLISILFLATLASNAIAGWEKVPTSAEGMTVYADRSSISKTEGTVTMASLYDFSKTQSEEGLEPYLSATFLIEYNCTNEQRRVLEFSNFTKNMGRGDEVFAYRDAGSWTPFELGSLSESLWKFACGKN
jgi:hypothetical protein